MTQRAQQVSLFLAGAGWIGALGTVLFVARTDDADFGGLVSGWVLGRGMIVSGLLLVSGAVVAECLVNRTDGIRERRNRAFLRITGVIGVVAILYGAAAIFV